ncbi:hypothetical protein GF319_11925 [Candidatus Bathyarchaeota archaeon]|jgi:hypothetical protein|nr:hypothetical protein [Candidatus Bathyarchaeota archaeon]
MNIGFFVEFPKEEIPKLSLLNFHVKVYLAANSLEEYRSPERSEREVNPGIETAYWPLLEKST